MMTIRDIAASAGVSIGTVSHVLNHPDRVHRTTRERVQHAMHQCGWQPNASAQTLRRAPLATVPSVMAVPQPPANLDEETP